MDLSRPRILNAGLAKTFGVRSLDATRFSSGLTLQIRCDFGKFEVQVLKSSAISAAVISLITLWLRRGSGAKSLAIIALRRARLAFKLVSNMSSILPSI